METNTGLSRRSFLKGFGAMAAAGAATGAGISATLLAENAEAVTVVDTDTATSTGYIKNNTGFSTENPSWLGEAPTIAESEISETIDTEIVVVGAATGGMPAVCAAAEEGAKICVIERQEGVYRFKEDIGAINSTMQKEYIAEHPEYEITEKDALEEIVRYANGYVNYDLVKVWIKESGAYIDWYKNLIEASGEYHLEFEAGLGTDEGQRDRAFATGHSPQKNGDTASKTIQDIFKDYADSKTTVDWRFRHCLVKLEQDKNGRVTGLIARNELTDKYVRVNASKGVIMATGGYSTNLEMMRAMQPEILDVKIACDGSGNPSTGIGIKAMMWAGARKDPVGTSMLFNRACCKPDATAGYGTPGRWFWFGEQPNLKVNLNGERFCNESGPYDYMLHAAYMQPKHTYCTIWDANHATYAEQFDEVGCCRLFPFPNGAKNNIPMKTVEGMIDKLITDGYVVKADTIEDLAKGLNIPVDTFKATIEKYNSYAAAKSDPDYFKEAHRLTPVDTAPFYGARTGAWHLTTLDGVLINTDMQVLDQDNNPIPGLFATGDCSGGFFSTTYPNLMTGLACGRTMTFGRHAGKYVAKL